MTETYDPRREDKLSHLTRNLVIPQARIMWFHHAPKQEMVLDVMNDEEGFHEEHRLPCAELDTLTDEQLLELVRSKVPAAYRKVEA